MGRQLHLSDLNFDNLELHNGKLRAEVKRLEEEKRDAVEAATVIGIEYGYLAHEKGLSLEEAQIRADAGSPWR